jgi:hypothetical protein
LGSESISRSPFHGLVNLAEIDSDPNSDSFYFLVATIVVANMFIFFTPLPTEEMRYVPAPAE